MSIYDEIFEREVFVALDHLGYWLMSPNCLFLKHVKCCSKIVAYQNVALHRKELWNDKRCLCIRWLMVFCHMCVSVFSNDARKMYSLALCDG